MKILSNLKYLFRKNLKKELKKLSDMKLEILYEVITSDDLLDNLKYELYEDIKTLKIPQIKTVDETIDELLTQGCSLCRFGDGELKLMEGESIPFQSASELLRKRLIQVFSSVNENVKIAIVRACYYSKDNLTDVNKIFWRTYGPRFRKLMAQYLDYNKQYYAAEMTLAYSFFQDYDCKAYFDKIRQIWNSKDIVLICGKTVFDQIEYNIFDNAKSIEYLYVPSVNAFDNYDEILRQVLTLSKEKLFILICGPTAKVLVYDLAQKGYRALDLGHIAKSYDWFIKNKQNNDSLSAADFFSPD